jgi:hypothetical protein
LLIKAEIQHQSTTWTASSAFLLIKAEIQHQSTPWTASSASLLIKAEIHQSTTWTAGSAALWEIHQSKQLTPSNCLFGNLN